VCTVVRRFPRLEVLKHEVGWWGCSHPLLSLSFSPAGTMALVRVHKKGVLGVDGDTFFVLLFLVLFDFTALCVYDGGWVEGLCKYQIFLAIMVDLNSSLFHVKLAYLLQNHVV